MDVTGTEHIAVLCGSQRDGSHTRRALERALDAAGASGATTDLVDYAGVESHPETSAACAVPRAD